MIPLEPVNKGRWPFWYVLTLSAIFFFYFWNCYSSNRDLFNGDGGRYGDVADALLHRQISLLIKPGPKLLSAPDPYDPHADRGDILWDGAYYKGKYYSDRELTPTLFLFLPCQLVKAGKARYLGASSMEAWCFSKMQYVAEQHG